jgi:hypothetical protein
VGETHGRDLSERLATSVPDSRVAIVHEPNRKHALVQPVFEPGRDTFVGSIEISAQDPQRSVSKRPNVHGNVSFLAPDDRSLRHHCLSGIELGKKLGFKYRVLGLPIRVAEREVRGASIEVAVSEDSAADDVKRELAHALSRRNPVSGLEFLDRNVSAFRQDWMITRELGVRPTHAAGSLGAPVRQTEDPPMGQRRRMPTDYATRNETSTCVYRHYRAVVARADESPNPFPGAVPELDSCPVSKALEYVRDVHVLTGQTDPAEQLIQEFPRLADEREALLVFVEARRFADEHQVRIGVTVTEDDLRPSLSEPASGASGCLRRVGG